MKRNYVPEGRTFSPDKVAQGNKRFEELSAKFLPFARATLESAIRRQTAGESAEAIADEARQMLQEVLSVSDAKSLDKESAALRETLTAALKAEPLPDEHEFDDEWMLRRSRALSRAIVAFWMNQGNEDIARYEACVRLLDELAAEKESAKARNYQLICSRFWLDAEESRNLLVSLHAEVLKIKVLEIVQPQAEEEIGALAWQRFFDEPTPTVVGSRVPELNLTECLLKMPAYSAFLEPARPLLESLDRIHGKQRVLIDSSSGKYRAQRLETLYRETTTIMNTFCKVAEFREAFDKPVSIQSARLRPFALKSEE